MLKQVEKEETVSKRSLDSNRPVLSAGKKARTEDVVQSETTVKECYQLKGISKEEFHQLSREDQILSQVCNNFSMLIFLMTNHFLLLSYKSIQILRKIARQLL